MKLLFVCSYGLQRSPTAAELWGRLHPGDEADYIGVFSASPDEIVKRVEWADRVVVMEEEHLLRLKQLAGEGIAEKTLVLNIPDVYYRNSPELAGVLERKFRENEEWLTKQG